MYCDLLLFPLGKIFARMLQTECDQKHQATVTLTLYPIGPSTSLVSPVDVDCGPLGYGLYNHHSSVV